MKMAQWAKNAEQLENNSFMKEQNQLFISGCSLTSIYTLAFACVNVYTYMFMCRNTQNKVWKNKTIS